MDILILHLQVGNLPRLCDVLWVLQEERDQCLQELSKEQPGALDEEPPVPGTRLAGCCVHLCM